jgi:hypothetical protein
MKSIINLSIISLFAFSSIAFGQDQYSWPPGDTMVVFMDSGSGLTFCCPQNWTIKKQNKNDEACLTLAIFDSYYNDPSYKGLDKIEHTYYVTLIPHMTISAETWSKKDVAASHIKKIKIKSKPMIECVLSDTTPGIYNGTLSRAVRYVENNYGVEITTFSFAQSSIPVLYRIANSVKFTKNKTP